MSAHRQPPAPRPPWLVPLLVAALLIVAPFVALVLWGVLAGSL